MQLYPSTSPQLYPSTAYMDKLHASHGYQFHSLNVLLVVHCCGYLIAKQTCTSSTRSCTNGTVDCVRARSNTFGRVPPLDEKSPCPRWASSKALHGVMYSCLLSCCKNNMLLSVATDLLGGQTYEPRCYCTQVQAHNIRINCMQAMGTSSML
jgi:hypothetical protein